MDFPCLSGSVSPKAKASRRIFLRILFFGRAISIFFFPGEAFYPSFLDLLSLQTKKAVNEVKKPSLPASV